jgi:hypothetical protein
LPEAVGDLPEVLFGMGSGIARTRPKTCNRVILYRAVFCRLVSKSQHVRRNSVAVTFSAVSEPVWGDGPPMVIDLESWEAVRRKVLWLRSTRLSAQRRFRIYRSGRRSLNMRTVKGIAFSFARRSGL